MAVVSTSTSEKFIQVLAQYQSRIQNTESSSLTLRESFLLAKSAPRISSSHQYSEIVFLRPPDFTGGLESTDASARRRYFVWFTLIKTFFDSKSFIWGLGPGFAGSAVDGNYIRIVAEYGLLGIVCYWKWFASLLRGSRFWFKSALAAVLVTGLYIDIFTSIKTSLILYIFYMLSNREKSHLF